MKKVLHLIQEYRNNSPLLNEYVRALPKNNFLSIVCYLSGQPDGKNELESIASKVYYLDFNKKRLEHYRFDVILSLYKILKENNIGILHCHRHKATVLGAISAKIAGIPNIISHVHGLNRTRSWKRRFANWVIFKHMKKIIAVSDSVRQDIINTNWRIDPEKVITIRNGINLDSIDAINAGRKDIRLSLNIPEDEIVFCTVGRLVPTKGQSYLIDAFSRVRKEIPNSRLIIIGDGLLAEKLKKKTKDLGLSSYVSFLGYRNDLLGILRGIDIFVLPSIAEGLSIALLEAMASRLPVIASNVGGIPEVFGTTNCGKLVNPRDVSALESAMIEVSSLSEERKRVIGENGRRRVEEEFTADRMSKKLSELYESIVH